MKKILIRTTLIAFFIFLIVFFAWDAGYFWDSSFKKQFHLAKQGNALSQSLVGNDFLFGWSGVRKNKKKAIYWLTKAAQQGNAENQYHLGQMYCKKYLRDKEKAIYWLTKAARQGYLDAQRVLAHDYASNLGAGI